MHFGTRFKYVICAPPFWGTALLKRGILFYVDLYEPSTTYDVQRYLCFHRENLCSHLEWTNLQVSGCPCVSVSGSECQRAAI